MNTANRSHGTSRNRRGRRPHRPDRGVRACLALAAIAVASCSLPPLSNWHDTPRTAPASRIEIGTASWYGPGFHGSPTSSGEIYDQHAMTAAHQSLPLGSRVMVTNLENGRVVELRINDRGPFVDGRIIDLSYAAARSLDLVSPGTARVSVERLGRASETSTVVAYAAQAAAFRDGARARALRETLGDELSGERVYVATYATPSERYHRVRVGPFPRREDALARVRHLDRLGLRAIVVEEVR